MDLAESVPTLRKALSGTDGDALCELVAETVGFTTREGAALSYCRPSIKVIGPWHDPCQGAAQDCRPGATRSASATWPQ